MIPEIRRLMHLPSCVRLPITFQSPKSLDPARWRNKLWVLVSETNGFVSRNYETYGFIGQLYQVSELKLITYNFVGRRFRNL